MMDLKQFEGTTVLVTGAAGLIGRTLIKKLFDWNEQAETPIAVIGMEFSEERAKAVLGEYVDKGLKLIIADVRDVKPENIGVDYIIHAASMTASKAFIETPVETVMISVDGTIKMLEFAKANGVKGFVYLSRHGGAFMLSREQENV